MNTCFVPSICHWAIGNLIWPFEWMAILFFALVIFKHVSAFIKLSRREKSNEKAFNFSQTNPHCECWGAIDCSRIASKTVPMIAQVVSEYFSQFKARLFSCCPSWCWCFFEISNVTTGFHVSSHDNSSFELAEQGIIQWGSYGL